MKSRVYKHPVRNKDTLTEAVLDVWDNIEEEIVRNVIQDLKRKLRLVARKRGGGLVK
jgi:hypothetical protein